MDVAGPPRWTDFTGPAVLAAAAIAAALGHRPHTALAIAGVALVLAHTLLFWDRARHALRTALQRIGHAVGTAVSWVFLSLVYFVIFTPVALLGRLRRRRPTREWDQRRRPPRGLNRRSFADERTWGAAPVMGKRAVIRTAVILLVLEGLIAGGVMVIRDRKSPQPQFQGVSSVDALHSAALRSVPWAAAAERESAEVSSHLTYSPFTDSSIRDFHGTYINVANRIRQSYQSQLARTKRPVNVWFFGGSTMFGFDLQRDQYTIPSQIVRDAEADGIPVAARNYGSAGYTNYEETTLLTLLVTSGQRPDVVVFYDGINDFSLQLLNAFGEVNPAGEPGDLGAQGVRQVWAESGRVPGADASPPSPLAHRPQTLPVTSASITQDVIDAYRQGVDLSRILAEHYGFTVVHYWQPDIYTKQPLDPGEQQLLPGLGLDQGRLAAMSALSAEVRQHLPTGVIDLAHGLDKAVGPVLSDQAHVNEEGARAVAAAMYQTLHATLTQREHS